MRCDTARASIGAFLDGELSGAERQAVASHLTECASCASLAADLRRLGGTLAVHATVPAPADLGPRIAARLRSVELEAGRRVVATTGVRALSPLRPWLVRAAVVLLVAGLAGATGRWLALGHLEGERLAHDVVAAHVRSLLQDQPVQVASADTHTVKPWFAGRLDYAVPVRDLATEGYPLAGGRLEYVGGKRVAALVYRRRLHVVNVLVWPTPAAAMASSAPRPVTLEGFNAVTWSAHGTTWWAVSDLNAAELLQLAELL